MVGPMEVSHMDRSPDASVGYYLVLLRGATNADDDQRHAPAHERFITSLIRRNVILLGGAFAHPVGDAYAAYVLRCASADEASRIAAEDPFVEHDVVQPDCVEWQLVGVNPEAIDAGHVVRPEDV
jgi:uncharacterized protein YciI